MTKYNIFITISLVCLATTVQCEVYYIGPSQLPNDADHHLTLSQFVYNSSSFLTNDTQLIFAPGNHSLESEILIENIHLFSMVVEPSFSSKAVVICDHNVRFEFRNISIVTVSGLDFIGCFENRIVSVGHFQIENSKFLGQAVVNGTILTIDESTATLDRVTFMSTLGTNLQYLFVNSSRYCPNALPDRATGVLSRRSVIAITQSWFEGNNVGLGRVIDTYDSNMMIFNTTFVSNSAATYCYYNCCLTGAIVYTSGSHESTSMVKLYDSKFMRNTGVVITTLGDKMFISHSTFINNSAPFVMVYATDSNQLVSYYTFIDNTGTESVLQTRDSSMSINHSVFINNNAAISLLVVYGRVITSVHHNKFIKNTSPGGVLFTWGGNVISVAHSEFVDNTVTSGSLIYLYGDIITVSLSEFINNRVYGGVLFTRYYIIASNLTVAHNIFIDNSAAYDIFLGSACKPGFSSSFGSPRCIKCPKSWSTNIVIIVIANIVAGTAIVFFMLALNLTVAVGTLNGILFYAHIVAANSDTYFFPFLAPNFITVFISWLNLDIGFDVCVHEKLVPHIKGLTQLFFPTYIILLVIIVIVASECSSKFAKIIGKGNPVAVLATMILFSYAKFLNMIVGSIYLLHFGPAYGSRNVGLATIGRALTALEKESDSSRIYSYFLIVVSILIYFLGILYCVLITFWQCFVQYQDKIICKWLRYPKLRHFMEPYHAPYTANYRYWTGLLLFIRVIVSPISALKFNFDPQIPVDLLSTIIVIGGLLFIKGVIAKRVYKKRLLDIIEITIYFNLVAFSALTWYNLHSEENQIAVAYTSVMIIFILLLGVIVFHILRYTRLYKFPFIEKAFKWISSKLLEKKSKQESLNDAPEELDGYQLERPDDLEQPAVTYSVIEIRQPAQNQDEENKTAY